LKSYKETHTHTQAHYDLTSPDYDVTKRVLNHRWGKGSKLAECCFVLA